MDESLVRAYAARRGRKRNPIGRSISLNRPPLFLCLLEIMSMTENLRDGLLGREKEFSSTGRVSPPHNLEAAMPRTNSKRAARKAAFPPIPRTKGGWKPIPNELFPLPGFRNLVF